MAAEVSVVICTYSEDRYEDLRASIESVRSQRAQPEDLIVVTDHADDLLERVRLDFPDVHAVPSTGPRGLSGARNTAAPFVRTPLVAYLDDDAVADAGWLGEMLTSFENPLVLGAGGLLVPKWDHPRPGWFPAEFDWVVGCTHRGMRTDPGPIRNPFGASMCFRTEVLREVGGFSTSLGRVGVRPVGCEETEACLRVVQRHPDGLFWYVPSSVAFHRVRDERSTWAYFRSRCYAEGLSKAHVSRLSRTPLSTERAYVTRVLPRALATHVAAAVVGREPAGLRRAAAVAGGLGCTTAGYLAGHARAALSRTSISRQNGVSHE